MGRTLDAARHYADAPNEIIQPTEAAKGTFVTNPPGAEALKLLHVLTKAAGERMAEAMEHEIRLADIRANEGMRNHDRASLRKLFIELAAAVMQYDDTDAMSETVSSTLPEAETDYRDEQAGNLLITWRFGKAFRKMAEQSDLYTILDKPTLLAMKSRYAMELFRHISTMFRADRITSTTFDIAQLRAVLGVPEGRHSRFSHLKEHAITPAVEEITRTSRFIVTAAPHRTGRTVTSVTISWTEKPAEQRRETKAELDRHSAGRKHRQAGTAERIADGYPPFPSSIHSFRGGFWETVYRDAGCKADMEATRVGFIEWTKRTDKPRTPQLFFNFCKGENKRKGVQ